MGAKYIIIACLLCADFVCFAQEKQKKQKMSIGSRPSAGRDAGND